MTAPVLGGVEAGGTKFVCGVGTGPDDLVRTVFPTTSPEETLERVVRYFRNLARPPAAIGIASFGPLDLDPRSATFGHIASTPKPGWSNFDIAGVLRRALDLPVAFDTDVNAAALAEARWGAAQGLDSVLYITVGTGIGGGALVNGATLHGLAHPEMGHIRIPHDREADPFPGACRYHGDCLEGLASGVAIERRWGSPADLLPPVHPAWPLEAHYLALGLANLVYVLSPRRIVMGGGVMHRLDLFPMIRAELQGALNGYVRMPEIVPPLLGGNAGVLGALLMAGRGAGL